LEQINLSILSVNNATKANQLTKLLHHEKFN